MIMKIDVDIREKLGAARDQRERPTCLVFAASAAHEVSRVAPQYLSTEFLFFAGAQRSHKDPQRGLNIHAVREALEQDGQPDEADWPYLAETPKVVDWLPPPIANPKHTARLEFKDRTVAQVREVLSTGKPVLLVIALTLAMYMPDGDGVVRQIANDTMTVRRHALLAVGCGQGDDGKYILVRNSWGERWGDGGHGWLHEGYLETCLKTTATIT